MRRVLLVGLLALPLMACGSDEDTHREVWEGAVGTAASEAPSTTVHDMANMSDAEMDTLAIELTWDAEALCPPMIDMAGAIGVEATIDLGVRLFVDGWNEDGDRLSPEGERTVEGLVADCFR